MRNLREVPGKKVRGSGTVHGPAAGCFLFAGAAMFLIGPAPLAGPLSCNLDAYQPVPGLVATPEGDALVVTWNGDPGEEVRLTLEIDSGRPTIRDLATRVEGGEWKTLASRLKPEFHVTSGIRRVSEQQLQPLRQLGVEITPEVIEREKWYVFWDAPLNVPGVREGRSPRNVGLPRVPQEIRRAAAVFDSDSCEVKTDGARLEVSFSGVSMGIFSGRLQYTVYRGTNLVRQEVIAKTEEPSVAYMYRAGLRGMSTGETARVAWRDLGGSYQVYQFGGTLNEDPVPLKAANRLLAAEAGGGTIVVLPPPHTFFWAREVERNLGYVWYRKDSPESYSVGILQPEGEEAEWARENFALYNAPPGTWQRMPVYMYPSRRAAPEALEAALAFTRGDRFKKLPGYQVMASHFHTRYTEGLRRSGSLDTKAPELLAMKAVGVNIANLNDFHGDLHQGDPGPLRLADQKDYFEAARRHSDRDFLIMPGEEANAYLGGHWGLLLPRPVFWTTVRREGQPFIEELPDFGTVYHVGSAADMFEMIQREDALVYQTHPRTKGSTGYPDAIRDEEYFRSEHFLGVAWKWGMGSDLSEKRLCEYRCLDLLDDMNNWTAADGVAPKYLFADVDTYEKGPGDDLYANFPVNYVKVDPLPGHDAFEPVLRALRNGDFFVTTGEVLFRDFTVAGTGSQARVQAEVEWTFPLEFLEIVWGDGKDTVRKIMPATDLQPFGTRRFSIPFDATGKNWVRMAVWDSAGNGAVAQPVRLDRKGPSPPGRDTAERIGQRRPANQE